MRTFTLSGLVLLLGVVAGASEPDDFYWREDCSNAKAWTPRPSWLSDASPTATAGNDGQAVCFRVGEPGRGMKWLLAMPPAALDETPWLVVRYRAENLDTRGTDYLVYLDDDVHDRQLNAIRLCDAVADGRWHVAAVDLLTLTEAESVERLAVQVRAGPRGKAALWLDWITLAQGPPEGAEIVRRAPAAGPKPDWTAPLAETSWTQQPSWLGNPAAEGGHRVERRGTATRFGVDRPGYGMKWSCELPGPVALEGHRYVSLRYRATGWRPYSDYAVWVFGKATDKDDPGHAAMVPAGELLSDGRWHTLNLDVRRLAARYPTITGLAVQLQAEAPRATLEVSDLRLVNARRPSKLADAVDWRSGAKFEGFRPVAIDGVARGETSPWRRHLRLGDWFRGPSVTVHDIPFARLENEPQLAATLLRGKSELRLPAKGRASEVYLLLLAALVGSEEPSYGSGKLRAIRDVDRFSLRLEYADGTADECLPMNVATRQFGIVRGVQVVAAVADASKELAAVVLCDRCKQGAFAVVGATLRTDGKRAFPEALEETPPVLRLEGTARAARLDAQIAATGPPTLERLVYRSSGWNYLAGPRPLVALRVDGKPVPPDDLKRIAGDGKTDEKPAGMTWFEVAGADGLRLGFDARPTASGGLAVKAVVRNRGPKEHTVSLVAPVVGPYRLGEKAEDCYYLVPRRGSVLDNRPRAFRERYRGLFPVQFLDTFCPAQGRGLVLRTEDTECLRKNYLLEKADDGAFTLGIEYPRRTLRPGETLASAPAVIEATDGNWRRGLESYRRWVATWYKPLSPRKPWFREVFNFRQRFLWSWDPLYDKEKGEFQLQRAVDEARREFGGIDYLHIFDWGNVHPYGRIYGRTGDHSPYGMFDGGREAFRRAIAGVRARGVPVGLYIEGYLLQEKGRLGQQFGRQWQLVGPGGKGIYWPDSSEMMVCPGVDAWREVQASTYAAKVRELDVDGMYIDQFGFAGAGKDCHAPDHGHPVPSYCVTTERDATRIIRNAIEKARRNVAVYTEETPVDVTSQYQDGSFSYAMNAAQRTRTMVPLNLARFALPDFKTIQILYCDKPTGSWATGVRWVFFNGEAIWLEGKADEWFEPETRAEIRRCYAILREHRDAFTTLEPEPLVPTELGGVYANRFPVPGKTVYTLYNARHRTVRGPVLRLPHREGATYFDAWHARPAKVVRDGDHDVIHTEIGPHGTGCVLAVQPDELDGDER